MFDLIGNTPLLEIPHPRARILGKWEGQNLTGSAKDRAVESMLDALAPPPGSTIIEATSGNTGISLAALSAARGLRCIIVMPENMSRERIARMTAYGAQVLLTPASDGMAGAVQLAKRLAADDPAAYYLNQFENPANAAAHFTTTGPEIWRDTGGNVDFLVAGVGTGGTISGAGRFLKQQSLKMQVIAVEPAPNQLIPGLGAGFLPPILDLSVIDEWIAVSAADTQNNARQFARQFGLLAGFSSGAALHAAFLLAERPENKGKTIVAILPDTGCRYLSAMP